MNEMPIFRLIDTSELILINIMSFPLVNGEKTKNISVYNIVNSVYVFTREFVYS